MCRRLVARLGLSAVPLAALWIAAPPAAAQGAWTDIANMGTPRAGHTAVQLADGRVMVSGGFTNTLAEAVSSSILYIPEEDRWEPVAAMIHRRTGHTATLLGDGRVLVVGGAYTQPWPDGEIYDPADDTWTLVPSTGAGRVGHTATLLLSGDVLVVGSAGPVIFRVKTGQWTHLGGPSPVNHTATLLPDGRVLIAGGAPCQQTALFDPDTNHFMQVADMQHCRRGHTAALLQDGRVLVVGSLYEPSTTEIFDPATESWSAGGLLGLGRYRGHVTTTLADGSVIVAGGERFQAGEDEESRVEIYDVAADTWTEIAPMGTPRSYAAAVLLADGRFLVTGGVHSYTDLEEPVTTNTAEIYTP